MSLDQLKAALARKRQGQTQQLNKQNNDTTAAGPRSQVATKKPAKKSAGRGR
jgi:hypothetical protein